MSDAQEKFEVRALRMLDDAIDAIDAGERDRAVAAVGRLRAMLTPDDYAQSLFPDRPLIPLGKAFEELEENGDAKAARRILKSLSEAWQRWRRQG